MAKVYKLVRPPAKGAKSFQGRTGVAEFVLGQNIVYSSPSYTIGVIYDTLSQMFTAHGNIEGTGLWMVLECDRSVNTLTPLRALGAFDSSLGRKRTGRLDDQRKAITKAADTPLPVAKQPKAPRKAAKKSPRKAPVKRVAKKAVKKAVKRVAKKVTKRAGKAAKRGGARRK